MQVTLLYNYFASNIVETRLKKDIEKPIHEIKGSEELIEATAAQVLVMAHVIPSVQILKDYLQCFPLAFGPGGHRGETEADSLAGYKIFVSF